MLLLLSQPQNVFDLIKMPLCSINVNRFLVATKLILSLIFTAEQTLNKNLTLVSTKTTCDLVIFEFLLISKVIIRKCHCTLPPPPGITDGGTIPGCIP